MRRERRPFGRSSGPWCRRRPVTGPTEDGWIVVAVHESKESWERFRDETLLPGLAQVENGFQGPPEETSFEVDRVHNA
jgi:hypothetical protein